MESTDKRSAGELAGGESTSRSSGQATTVVGDVIQAVLSSSDLDKNRGEVSAQTIGRMLGLVTVSELKVLEGKLDLVVTKLSSVMVKVEKAVSTLAGMPSGSDLERIDVQIGALRSMIRDVMSNIDTSGAGGDPSAAKGTTEATKERPKILTNKQS